MATGYFVVQNGLQVGPLTIDAATGTINTSGDVSITGNLGVSQISKNDSSVKINDTGSGSNIVFTVDGGVEHTMSAAMTTLYNALTVTGNIVSNSGTASSSTTTGALVLNGGAGISGAIYAGSIQNTPIGSTTASTGAFTTLTTSSVLTASGNIVAASGTGSSSTTTGALVSTGGAGIAGNINLGGNLVITANAGNYIGVPVGSTAQRPGNPSLGMMRYNYSISAFEGYSSGAWSSLGGVKSVDGLTYIQAETSPGASNDQLEFFVANSVSTTTREVRMDQYSMELNGNLYISPVTNGVNQAKIWSDAKSLSDADLIIYSNVNSFVQMAIHNDASGTSASTDFIAYADKSDNTNGFIDMGIAATTFTDATYGVTNAGDGYIFLNAPKYANATATGGNLVLATADGVFGDIVFAAGGFVTGTEQGRFVTDDGLYLSGNLVASQGVIYQGESAKNQEFSANSTATLSTTINAAVTSFTVNSTTGFLNHGVLYVGTELMYYSGKTSNSFTGITRATGGTTAQTHTSGKVIYQPIAGLTNASGIFVGNQNDFVQFSLKNLNSGSGASTDLIAYASNGDNDSGWIDMGITGENFDDPAFGVTGKDDGYIFMSAPTGTPGNGDLFISTDGTGQKNDIVFSTGGFADSTFERMRIIGTSRVGKPAGVEIYIGTNATSTTTGALRVQGGMGLQGNLFVGGNFNLTGNITIGGTGSTTSTSTLVVENPINFLANANAGDSQDIGVVGQYVSGGTKYVGLVRDSGTKSFRFFDGLTTKPTTTVTWSGTTAGNVYMGQLTVANSTASTTTTSGAAIIIGGLGVGGAVNAGGDVNFSSNTQASNDTTGALRVKGGISIQTGSLYAGGAAGVAINVRGDIVPTANLTYNLGTNSAWFNTFYGVSTQAKYADLAENYQADAQYEPGTVVEFGGEAEVTIATEGTKRVAGVVSTNPAHLMNGSLQGRNVVPLALQGRVPCKVIGPVQKGDLMISAGFGYARANNDAATGQVIGKALADFTGAKGVIEVVVGRL
jgi:hypothetical protein